jgi:hypothetical protein
MKTDKILDFGGLALWFLCVFICVHLCASVVKPLPWSDKSVVRFTLKIRNAVAWPQRGGLPMLETDPFFEASNDSSQPAISTAQIPAADSG